MRNDELTPDEKRAFASLQKERQPSPGLETRTVRALRASGFLRGRYRFPLMFAPLSWAGSPAVMIMLMAGTFIIGYMTGKIGDPSVSRSELSETAPALSLQKAATDYLEALDVLDKLAQQSDPESTHQGREIALNLLHAIAEKTAGSLPASELAQRIRESLEDDDLTFCIGPETGIRRIIWF